LKAHHLGRDWGERELYEALRVEARNLANEFGRVFPDSVPRAIASFVAAGGEEASL
ncbi:hypothetical protein HQ520_18080, partial [bacterium]|nr:hypothetical protein [bacterium]